MELSISAVEGELSHGSHRPLLCQMEGSEGPAGQWIVKPSGRHPHGNLALLRELAGASAAAWTGLFVPAVELIRLPAHPTWVDAGRDLPPHGGPMTAPIFVEYQLLHLVVSYTGDERVTLAVLYWDGQRLRFRFCPGRVPSWLDINHEDLGRTLDAIERTVTAWASQASPGQRLSQVAPVRQGEGSLLMWGPIQTARTRFPGKHFDQLLGLLHLQGLELQ